jgi:hypothetical protein
MMPVMVQEADLNRIEVHEDYEVLDATALGRRLGFKRDTELAYLSCPLPYPSSVLLGCTWTDSWSSRGGATKGNRLPVLSRSARIAGAILQGTQLGVEL